MIFRTLLAMVITFAVLPAASIATPPSGAACPVTIGTTVHPPAMIDPFEKDANVFHENGLWVSVPADGKLTLGPDDAITFGPLTGWRSTEVQWLRDEGVEGFIIVSGKRLDAKSELTPKTPLSPQRQYVKVGPVKTGLAFPDAGCWQVTGTVGNHSVTWAVDIKFVMES